MKAKQSLFVVGVMAAMLVGVETPIATASVVDGSPSLNELTAGILLAKKSADTVAKKPVERQTNTVRQDGGRKKWPDIN